MHESKVSRNNSYKSSSSSISHSSSGVAGNVSVHNNNNASVGGGTGGVNKKDGKHSSGKKRNMDNDGNPATTMSNLSTYSLIDDDHIDDQETINVGNLIIDLESDLEKEKNEQAGTKPDTCTTIANSSSTYTLGASSNLCNTTPTPNTQTRAASSSSTPTTTSSKSQSGARSSQKSSNKYSSSNATPSTKSSCTVNASNSIGNNNNCTIEPNNGSNGGIINSSNVGSGTVIVANNDNNQVMTTRTVFKSSADERGELKMRITRETKPGKSEHKIITSPNHQKSPISSSSAGSSGINQSSDDVAMTFGEIDKGIATTLQLKQTQPQTDLTSISSTKECGTSTSIGTITEPECLGPCEPGTSVTLEGIVWQETEGGILVVNVTWRGKTYVGALLDCTRHDWAPPRLCDSPASDIDLKSSKGVRPKRIVTRSNGIGVDEKNLLQTTGKLRNGKGRRILNDPATSNKRQRESDRSNENASNDAGSSSAPISHSETTCVPMKVDASSTPSSDKSTPTAPAAATSAPTSVITTTSTTSLTNDKMFIDKGPNSPMLIGCTEPNCSKKYRNMNGLLYHRTHAHGAESDSKTSSSPPAAASDNAFAGTSAPTTDVLPSAASSSNPGLTKDSSKISGSLVAEQKNVAERGDSKSPPDLQFIQEKMSSEAKRFHRSDARSTSPRLDPNFKPSAGNSLPKPNVTIGEANQRHGSAPLIHEAPSRVANAKISDPERRSSLNSNHTSSSINDPLAHQHHHSRRSPSAPRQSSLAPGVLPIPPTVPHASDIGHTSSAHHHPPSSKSSSKQQLNQPPPLPATTEEGMKPSGTSTGPPPAPHQANCYFNSAFLASSYAYPLSPYFPRQMFDQVTPPPMQPSPALLSRFMNNMRVPPPDSPSRMLSPSIPKNLPFPQYKIDPLSIPLSMPNSQFPPNPPPLPHNISSMTNPPLATGSPHLRMPSHGDPMLPPTSQPPFLTPTSVNPTQGLPGPANPMGPIGGPQVPSLVEDPMKQFPRRFN